MSNDLLLTMLEMLEKASQNENSGKMQQYNTRNRNVMRPVQRPSYNSGAGRRPNPYGRPDAKGEHILEGDPGFEDGQGHEGSYSLEGVGQGSLDYISPEGEQGPEGSHSTKGSARAEGNTDAAKNSILEEDISLHSASYGTLNLDFSEISQNDMLRGIILSEILSKPKAFRRGR